MLFKCFHLLEHGWSGHTECVFMVVYRRNMSVFHLSVLRVHVPHHPCLPPSCGFSSHSIWNVLSLLATWLFCKALLLHLRSATIRHLRLQLFQGSVSSKLDFNFSDSSIQHNAGHIVQSLWQYLFIERKGMFQLLFLEFLWHCPFSILILLLCWLFPPLLELKLDFRHLLQLM